MSYSPDVNVRHPAGLKERRLNNNSVVDGTQCRNWVGDTTVLHPDTTSDHPVTQESAAHRTQLFNERQPPDPPDRARPPGGRARREGVPAGRACPPGGRARREGVPHQEIVAPERAQPPRGRGRREGVATGRTYLQARGRPHPAHVTPPDRQALCAQASRRTMVRRCHERTRCVPSTEQCRRQDFLSRRCSKHKTHTRCIDPECARAVVQRVPSSVYCTSTRIGVDANHDATYHSLFASRSWPFNGACSYTRKLNTCPSTLCSFHSPSTSL